MFLCISHLLLLSLSMATRNKSIVESEACIIYTQFIISVIIHSTTRVNVC